jgi:hypothetical protein
MPNEFQMPKFKSFGNLDFELDLKFELCHLNLVWFLMEENYEG